MYICACLCMHVGVRAYLYICVRLFNGCLCAYVCIQVHARLYVYIQVRRSACTFHFFSLHGVFQFFDFLIFFKKGWSGCAHWGLCGTVKAQESVVA